MLQSDWDKTRPFIIRLYPFIKLSYTTLWWRLISAGEPHREPGGYISYLSFFQMESAAKRARLDNYKCPSCPAEYNYKRNCTAHRRKKHGDDAQIRAEKVAAKNKKAADKKNAAAEKKAIEAAAKAAGNKEREKATKARPFNFSKDVDRGQVRNFFYLLHTSVRPPS